MTQSRARYGALAAPFILVVLVLIAWTAWWHWLSRQVEARLDLAAQTLRAQGWEVVYSDPELSGWPFRTRLDSRHVRITAPTGHEIAAPRLSAEANAYRPDRWVMAAQDGLVVTRADKGKVAVDAPVIRASASGLSQPFPNLALEAAEVVFTAHEGAEPFPLAGAERIEFYMRPSQAADLAPEPDAVQQTALTPQARNVDVLFRLIGGRGRSGGPIAYMSRDGLFELQAETVIENFQGLRGSDAAGLLAAWTASGGRFLNVRGEMRAGDSAAMLSSDVLRADDGGRLEGVLSLSGDRAAPALSGLARSDAVNGPAAMGAAAVATAGEAISGDVSLEVTFRDGRAWVGPFDLAPAPELF